MFKKPMRDFCFIVYEVEDKYPTGKPVAYAKLTRPIGWKYTRTPGQKEQILRKAAANCGRDPDVVLRNAGFYWIEPVDKAALRSELMQYKKHIALLRKAL